MNDINEDQLKEAVRAVLGAPRVKRKIPPPTKRDLNRRFKLTMVRGKPRMVEVK